jgi:nitroreductase
MEELIPFLNSHVSVRSFTEQQISPEQERIIVETAQRSPTSSNLQTYTIIGVRDQETKRKLMALCHDQAHIAAASLFLVFCADLYRLTVVTKERGYEPLSEYSDKFLTASMDATLVAGRALQTAQAMGLGGVMVGAIRIHTQEVCELLGLPELVYPVMGMSLGYPKAEPKKKPRLSSDVIYHRERYEMKLPEAALAEYDGTLDAIGYLKGREVDKADYPNFRGRYSWQEHSARRMASRKFEALRPDLLEILKKRGFLLK